MKYKIIIITLIVIIGLPAIALGGFFVTSVVKGEAFSKTINDATKVFNKNFEQDSVISRIESLENENKLSKEKTEQAEEIINKIRSLSTRLKSKTKVIPYYHCLEKYNFVLKNRSINDACSALIGLSNSVYILDGQTISNVEGYKKTISENLKINI